MDKHVRIYQPKDCIDEMLFGLKHGKVKGTTTYSPLLDNAWTWRLQEFNIWTGFGNEGKALALSTLIPTSLGFYTMEELKVGHIVYDENGKECRVVAKSEVFYNRPCYKVVFSDDSEVICDENHLWTVDTIGSRSSKSRQRKKSGILKKRGTDQTFKCKKEVTLPTKEMVTSYKKGKDLEYSVNVCKPIEYSKKELTVPPYVLGLWLGDGSKDSGQITTADAEILKSIESYGYTVTDHVNKYSFGILKLRAQLSALNVLKNKHIPFEYLFSSVDDRFELMKGLMDSDGYTDKLGRCEYTTISYHLAEHARLLFTSLGIKVYITEDEARLNGRYISQRYRLRFKTDFEIFKLKRKLDIQKAAKPPKNNCRLIKSITRVESVPTQCIEVDSPNNLYLCTEDCIPTHNSLFLKQLCLIKVLEEGCNFIFSSPEDYPPGEFFDDMIHTLAGATTDKFYPEVISKELYVHCYELIKDHFHFIYIKPPYNTIEATIEQAENIIKEQKKITGLIIDPILKFSKSKTAPDRDDQYAGYIGALLTDVARVNNISVHMVMHQLTPKLNDFGLYPKPNMYSVKGGGSWADGVDNVIFVQRPMYAKDKEDTSVIFGSQKIKKQKLVGIPQEVALKFDRFSNRYRTEDGDFLFNFDKFIKKPYKTLQIEEETDI